MDTRIAVILLGVGIAGCATDHIVGPPETSAPPMSLYEARQIVRETFQKWCLWGGLGPPEPKDCTVSDVRLDAEGVSAIVAWRGQPTPQELRAPFRGPLGGYKCQEWYCWVEMQPTPKQPGYWVLFMSGQMEARRLVQAYDSLVARQRPATEMPDEFAEAAKAWRAAKPKPALSAEGERRRVLAEAALRENDIDRAVEHYEAGLEKDPTWPGGNFNLALLLGEAGYYGSAVKYMRRYLLLVPEAKDAKAAREKIIVWEDKASRGAQ